MTNTNNSLHWHLIESVAAFQEAAQNPDTFSFITLCLRNMNISPADMKIIAQALNNIKYDNLSLLFTHNSLDEECVRYLAEGLAHTNLLARLSITILQSNLTNISISYLTQAIKHCQFAKLTLNLYGTRLDLQGLKALGELIASGEYPQIFHLDLGATFYYGKKAGLPILIDALANHNISASTGKRLSLRISVNGLDDDDAQQIATKLAYFPSNLSLDVANNLLTDKGKAYFADAITDNLCPPAFSLKLAEGSKECIEKFGEALKNNTSVIDLYFDKGIPDTIKHCLTRNQLLLKYQDNPDLLYHIKKCSKEAGVYTGPLIDHIPPSLKMFAATYIRSLENLPKNYLPTDLKEYITALKQPINEVNLQKLSPS